MATDIGTDPSCNRTTDSDMAFSSSSARKTPWLWVAAPATQIIMALTAAQPSDTNKAIGCSTDPRLLCGL
ncbi:hypothetical protein STEG23_003627 [Scotinomys teguina]